MIWFGVCGSDEHGLGVIPASLLMRTILAILPDGRRAPMPPNAGDFAGETVPLLVGLLAEGKLRPRVADRVPLDEAERAHELLERGGVEGKIVLVTEAHRPRC